MPSWNIHIAHAERLLSGESALARAVLDRNAFVFGCLVPDIYVGYMVPAVAHPIAYRITHFAARAHIPKPREQEFWDAYVAPRAALIRGGAERCAGGSGVGTERPAGVSGRAGAGPGADAPQRTDAPCHAGASPCADVSQCAATLRPADASQLEDGLPSPGPLLPASISAEQERVNRVHFATRTGAAPVPPPAADPRDADCSPEAIERSVCDLVLGTWTHLLADNLWNTRVNQFLDAHGGKPSEAFRIKKQGDFDLFGKALPIDTVPRVTSRLIATARAFPQYPIEEELVYLTVGVSHEIVRTNHGSENPTYQLLTADFFEYVFSEFQQLAERLFEERIG